MVSSQLSALGSQDSAIALQGGSAGAAALLRPGENFNDMLNRLAGKKQPVDKRKQAEKVAGDLVSNALILPILKQNRHSVFNQSGPFAAGTGEKTFGPEFDIQIADRITHSGNMGITKALADRLTTPKGSVISQVAQTKAWYRNGKTLNGQVNVKPIGVDVHG
jgi:hypothetical protein